jgi:two-component system response regulator YesN
MGAAHMYKLFVVDDEELDRKLVKLMLEGNCQFKIVGEATDGLEAIRKARELEPDAILMDIRMPNKNGLDAAKEIKSFLSRTKIIFLTAYDDFHYAKGAIEGKASAYLLKPIEQEELLEKLSNVAQELTTEAQQAQRMARLMSEIEANLDLIRTRFFNELLAGVWSGDEPAHEYFNERLSFLKLDVLPDTVIVFKIGEFLKKQAKTPYIFFELSRYEVLNYITNRLKTYFTDNLLSSDSFAANYLTVAVPVLDAARRKKLLDLLREMQQYIQAKYSISFSAGIGSPCHDILHIAKSYEEAMIALTSFDSTEDVVICYEDLGEKESIISYSSYLEQQLLLTIRAGNLEKAQKLIGRFLSFFVNKTELEMGKMVASEIILKASRFLSTSRIKKLNTDEDSTAQIPCKSIF